MAFSAVHLIGCGGAGTQPLAMIFQELGYRCSGSDLIENNRTEALKKAGVKVCPPGHREENLPDVPAEDLLVVYTSAATKDNPELSEAHRRGCVTMRRGEALAEAAKRFPVTAAVCGSHGKTSVTSMMTHILRVLGKEPGCLIGGNLHGNPVSGTAGAGKLFVSEVDESDSTNALFSATLAIVTNIEDDHCWSVGGTEALFESFRSFARNAKHLLYVSGPNPDRIFAEFSGKSTLFSGVPAGIDWPADWGGFQREDASIAVQAVGLLCPELTKEEIIRAMLTFPGVERRMSLRKDNGIYRVMEDYAHHPTELAASLSAFRETNPGRRLVVIFQPHRYARLQRYFSEFVRVLSSADQVFITPVFAAWTGSSPVNSETLAEAIGPKATALSGSWKDMGNQVRAELRENDLAAVIGAGDLQEILKFL